MKPRLIAIFLLLVLAPLALLAWLGVQAGTEEQRRVDERFQAVFSGQLADFEEQIGKVVGAAERSLYAATERAVGDAAEMRALVRRERLVKQVFVRDPGGRFVHPAEGMQRTDQEKAFFDRTRSVWESGVQFGRGGAKWQVESYTQQQAVSQRSQVPQLQANGVSQQGEGLVESSDPATGWYGWFWGDGLNWIYWRQAIPGGAIVGFEVDRVAFLSDVIAALPTDTSVSDGRVILSDARGDPIYQWGKFEPGADEAPIAERALGVPLAGLRLLYHAASPEAGTANSRAGIIGALIASGIALTGLALYFFRENSREMREAARKVSFVNQVSHELKTPLTNIRMYAELAGEKLDDESDPGLRKCIDVVEDESGRLSRLIGNVLTFARKGRGVTIRRSKVDVDAVIKATVNLFRPALDRAGVEVELDSQIGDRVIDGDVLEQILANLIGNVEKYASAGGWMGISARVDKDLIHIAVEDRGPGIAKASRKRIFTPFERLTDSVTEGVAGTGIGLSIARDLARAHGGDLCVKDTGNGKGSRFVLTLEIT